MKELKMRVYGDLDQYLDGRYYEKLDYDRSKLPKRLDEKDSEKVIDYLVYAIQNPFTHRKSIRFIEEKLSKESLEDFALANFTRWQGGKGREASCISLKIALSFGRVEVMDKIIAEIKENQDREIIDTSLKYIIFNSDTDNLLALDSLSEEINKPIIRERINHLLEFRKKEIYDYYLNPKKLDKDRV